MNPKQEAAKLALTKLFAPDTHFSICTIRELVESFNLIIDKDTYNTMSLVHCVKYRDMTPEFREWLFTSTMNMFASTGFQLEFASSTSTPEKAKTVEVVREVIKTVYVEKPRPKGFLQRLLN